MDYQVEQATHLSQDFDHNVILWGGCRSIEQPKIVPFMEYRALVNETVYSFNFSPAENITNMASVTI